MMLDHPAQAMGLVLTYGRLDPAYYQQAILRIQLLERFRGRAWRVRTSVEVLRSFCKAFPHFPSEKVRQRLLDNGARNYITGLFGDDTNILLNIDPDGSIPGDVTTLPPPTPAPPTR